MNPAGHCVLITGGATGIGFALAKQFHASGNRVIVVGRSEQKLAAVLKLEGHATVGAQVAAVLRKGVAHIGHSTGFVIGQAIDHDGGAANAVAFVT